MVSLCVRQMCMIRAEKGVFIYRKVSFITLHIVHRSPFTVVYLQFVSGLWFTPVVAVYVEMMFLPDRHVLWCAETIPFSF